MLEVDVFLKIFHYNRFYVTHQTWSKFKFKDSPETSKSVWTFHIYFFICFVKIVKHWLSQKTDLPVTRESQQSHLFLLSCQIDIREGRNGYLGKIKFIFDGFLWFRIDFRNQNKSRKFQKLSNFEEVWWDRKRLLK